MIHWSAMSFVAALIVGILGLGGISDAAAEIATVPFFVFLAFLAIIGVFGGRGIGRRVLPPSSAFRLFHKTEGDGASPPRGATAPAATTKTRLT